MTHKKLTRMTKMNDLHGLVATLKRSKFAQNTTSILLAVVVVAPFWVHIQNISRSITEKPVVEIQYNGKLSHLA